MSTSPTGTPNEAATPRRRWLRSIAAVAAAVVANGIVTTVTDHFFHVIQVYPPWGEAMHDTGDNLLALGYRIVYAVLFAYLAARLAPRAPMAHALALGVVGLVLSSVGAFVAITQADLGPAWYPLSVAAVALPCAWLGGALYRGGTGLGQWP